MVDSPPGGDEPPVQCEPTSGRPPLPASRSQLTVSHLIPGRVPSPHSNIKPQKQRHQPVVVVVVTILAFSYYRTTKQDTHSLEGPMQSS